jgi:hypothetical protein
VTEGAETPEELPMACSLDSGGLQDRLRRLAELGAASLLGSEGESGSRTLRFRDDPQTRAALDVAVRAEGECCPFLDLSVSRAGGELVLAIEAPAGGEAIADELAAAFRGTVE